MVPSGTKRGGSAGMACLAALMSHLSMCHHFIGLIGFLPRKKGALSGALFTSSQAPPHQYALSRFFFRQFQSVFPVIEVYIVQVSVEGVPALSCDAFHLDDMAFFGHHAVGEEVDVFFVVFRCQLAAEFFFHGLQVVRMDGAADAAAGQVCSR